MARMGRRLLAKLLPWLFVFAAGVAVGFYVRDQQQHKRIERAITEARRDMERTAQEAMEIGRRAGEDFQASVRAARVAAESTKAALHELTGDSEGQ